MTTDQVLKAIAERGLAVVLHEGKPVLRGPKAEVTPKLLNALRWHREEIARRLTPENPVATAEPCPACGKLLDSKARCWALKCGWRRCGGCGRNTGSVFIANCDQCALTRGLQGGWND